MSRPRYAPVKPDRLEIVAFYNCPSCRQPIPSPAPFEPASLTCPICGATFPIFPVDDTLVNFFRVMTVDGKAAINDESTYA